METNKRDELAKRLLSFAVRIIKLVNALPKTIAGKHIGGQLLKSGTSPGANYEEACGAEMIRPKFEMLNAKFTICIVLLIFMRTAVAYANGTGTAGASFLNIGMGVRPAGMGGAFTGIADDANTIYYNPAGLIQLKTKELTFIHTTWLAEVEAQHLGFATAIGEKTAFGISGTYLHTEDVERDILGEELDVFRDYYQNLNLAYARAISQKLSLGVTFKWVYGSLAEHEASTYGLDLGLLYKTGLEGLSLGFTAQNIGGRMTFIEEEDPLPLNLKLGIGYRPINNLILGFDVTRPDTADRFRLGLGAEYTIARILSLRTGFSQKGDDEFSGITAGAGINLFGLQLDYAWVPYGELGDTNRYSLLLRLGSSPPSHTPTPPAEIPKHKDLKTEEPKDQKTEEPKNERTEETENERTEEPKNLINQSPVTNLPSPQSPPIKGGEVKKEKPPIKEGEVEKDGSSIKGGEVEKEKPINQLPITNNQSPIRMAAKVYEDPRYVKLYVHLENVGDEPLCPGLTDFSLLTEGGRIIYPSPSYTYTTRNYFSPGFLPYNSEIEGFIIFNTKELPKTLTYKDFFGNEVSVNLP